MFLKKLYGNIPSLSLVIFPIFNYIFGIINSLNKKVYFWKKFNFVLITHRNIIYNCYQGNQVCFRFRHHSLVYHKHILQRLGFPAIIEKLITRLKNYMNSKKFLFLFLLFQQGIFLDYCGHIHLNNMLYVYPRKV